MQKTSATCVVHIKGNVSEINVKIQRNTQSTGEGKQQESELGDVVSLLTSMIFPDGVAVNFRISLV